MSIVSRFPVGKAKEMYPRGLSCEMLCLQEIDGVPYLKSWAQCVTHVLVRVQLCLCTASSDSLPARTKSRLRLCPPHHPFFIALEFPHHFYMTSCLMSTQTTQRAEMHLSNTTLSPQNQIKSEQQATINNVRH